MMSVDKLGKVFNYGKLYEDHGGVFDFEHMEVERVKRYSNLMESSDTPGILLRESLNVIIPIQSSGWLYDSDGWVIAFERSNAKPENLLSNLDLFKKESDEWEDAYSHIEDNWYLKIVW